MYAEDSIAAIATPAGHGGVGIVRVSGALSTQVATALFCGTRRVESWVSHHLYSGRVVDPAGVLIDDALAVLMRAPHSYTGEDVLELHCHGSPIVLRQLLEAVLQTGARLAEPGEFTKRAFLNGRLDLAQAEAVIDLIHARTETAAGLAVAQLTGQLSVRLDTLRSQLVDLKALLEAQIDFSEEDFRVEPAELLAGVDAAAQTIASLLATYAHGKLVRDGLRVTIVGKPNVGKSSLLNALLCEERAIVTPIAGTTRDTIEECADFGGIPVVLTDTAGLRNLEDADAVERLGMERTSAAIAAAHLVVAVIDGSQPLDAADHAALTAASSIPSLLVVNKSDLPESSNPADLGASAPIIRVSALTGAGLADLRAAIIALAHSGVRNDELGPVLTNLRHHASLSNAAASLDLVRDSLLRGQPADVIAVDVQDAIDHIGAITGIVTHEDVLDRVFSQFCIGK